MKPLSRLLSAALVLLVAGDVTASETARVGGSGGTHTVTMDCGPGAYIVGITATGGRDGAFGFNLLRRVKFTCRPFTGTTPGAGTSETGEAVAAKGAAVNVSNGSGICPNTQVMYALELFAGTFIDRLNSGGCIDSAQVQSFVNINAGGDGGTRAFVECPAAEALFRVDARVGDAIDSLRGFCRSFGTLSSLSVPTQIRSTANPNPTPSNPVIIPVNANKVFSFTVSNFNAAVSTVLIGVSGQTDFLGGGNANPAEFKVELINPSGTVVASKSFSNVQSLVIEGVTFRINANGTWKLRVTNLKKSVGTLNITSFSASAPAR
jgi:hypothetical protein